MKISAGMLSKLDKIKERYNEIGELLSKSEVIADQKQFRELGKELAGLMKYVSAVPINRYCRFIFQKFTGHQ